MWMTWANALSAIRVLLAVPCAVSAAWGAWTAAALLLSLAILTDLLDGPLARRLHQSSALGGLIDHATDAGFVALLLAALWHGGYVTWLLPVLVLLSFLQYALDSHALRGQRLRSSWLGRANGIGYFVLAAALVYRNALGLAWPSDVLVHAAAWLLVLSTLASMLERFRVWRRTE